MFSSPGPRLLTIGRINLDLYSRRLGDSLEQTEDFFASVGGSPTNIAIAARRLGTSSAVLTAVGDDGAGRLVLRKLRETGVSTGWVRTVAGRPTSMALLAVIGPDDIERLFYRTDTADMHLDPSLVATLPWESLRLVLVSGDALAREPTSDLAKAVIRECRSRNVPVWMDLDARVASWSDMTRYPERIRPLMSDITVVIGTREEFRILLGLGEHDDPLPALGGSAISTAIVKTGKDGAVVVSGYGRDSVAVSAAASTLVSTVGAGDSFAGALAHAHLNGTDWLEAVAFAMRAAAWTVGQPGCSDGFPTQQQLDEAANS